MNDLHLHSRLAHLADDLAPDADPDSQVAGARALHHRRQRTRLGVAGAAVAVALVTAGVPTAMNTLSDPGGDAAAPFLTEGSPRAAEQLRAHVEALEVWLGAPGPEGPAPDPGEGVPCPDAADVLGAATGMTLETGGENAGGGTLTGCSWSTDDSATMPAQDRLDVVLRGDFEATAETLRRALDESVVEDRCRWTTLPSDERFAALQVCDGPQTRWELTVLDDDGVGAWVLSSFVGTRVPEAFGVGAGTINELWRVVLQGVEAPTVRQQTGVEVAGAAEVLAMSFPGMSRIAAPVDPSCPASSTPELENYGLDPQPSGSSTDDRGCLWSAAAPASEDRTPLTGRIAFRSDPPVLGGDECSTSPIPGWTPGAELSGCLVGDSLDWTLVAPAADGRGGWVISAGGDAQDVAAVGPTSLDVLVELVDLADRTW